MMLMDIVALVAVFSHGYLMAHIMFKLQRLSMYVKFLQDDVKRFK